MSEFIDAGFADVPLCAQLEAGLVMIEEELNQELNALVEKLNESQVCETQAQQSFTLMGAAVCMLLAWTTLTQCITSILHSPMAACRCCTCVN